MIHTRNLLYALHGTLSLSTSILLDNSVIRKLPHFQYFCYLFYRFFLRTHLPAVVLLFCLMSRYLCVCVCVRFACICICNYIRARCTHTNTSIVLQTPTHMCLTAHQTNPTPTPHSSSSSSSSEASPSMVTTNRIAVGTTPVLLCPSSRLCRAESSSTTPTTR